MAGSELDDLRAVYEPLAQAVRRLVDVTIRTCADAATVEAVTNRIDCASDELSASLLGDSFGVQHTRDGEAMVWGNVVIGVRNPAAPPLVVHHDTDGRVWAEFTLGAAFEGPPGHVHGGVCAMLLDHVLGATAHKPGKPAVTGTLTMRYRRGTRLGHPLRAQAWVERIEGVKTFAVGHIVDADGVTVEAEGVFIHPRVP
ncbi:PaaI family thioesterase [Mycobacterium sp. 852014-52144_SCH5372336]|uniref:PaaI family thioesterase n=1 Tax=Mycobacterium sp. 852014-52144_SCH5372336 TaxID=1834115 RepID=UPI00080175E6|nr:PaaI family thioesterase [Mycobacterium sp. 852014-52144_SCH5372336]OBB72577.1 thioesterase [Mycobacterium sp. 852014-52144_SCH5372336]